MMRVTPDEQGRRVRAFEQRTVLEIHRLACDVGLADRRDVLIGSLGHRVRAKLFDPPRRADRMLADLHVLNAWIDADGAAPLMAEWLATAARMVVGQPASPRFERWAAHAARPLTPRQPAATFEMHPDLREARRRLSQLEAARGAAGAIRAAMEELKAIKRRIRSGGSVEPGDVLVERFVIGERLGGGGFATVWRAYDEQRAAEVAVKVLHGRWNRDASRIERFRRGATKLGQLHDVPGVVELVSVPTADDQWHFFAMEYLDGGDLQGAVLRAEPLPTAAGMAAVLAAADALGEAHRRGMVHRDIKPSNILLDGRGRAKVGDFDLVMAGDTTGGTGTGPLGTVLYAAPELLDRPGEAEPTADVYGLGMTAIFVLHGEELPRSMIRRPDIVLGRLPVSDPVRRLLGEAIDWHPTRRPADAGAFAAALRAALDDAPLGLAPAEVVGAPSFVMCGPPGSDGRQPSPPERPTPPPRPVAVPVATPRPVAVPVAAPRPTPVHPTPVAIPPRTGHDFTPPPPAARPQMTDPAIAPVSLAGAEPQPRPATELRPGLVHIPPGRFEMGSPLLEWGRRGDEARHAVRLTGGVWMAVSPISGASYRRVVGARRGAWDPGCPVTAVTWLMAARYCNALSRREGLTPAYAIDGKQAARRPDADGYRLPSEAEWEYACRAGTATRHWCGDDEDRLAEVAVFIDSGRRRVEACGERPANPWGLFDMHGNVWEWCHDVMGLYGGAAVDPFGPARGARRVVRGGAYNCRATELRSACRAGRRASEAADDIGFRVVRPA